MLDKVAASLGGIDTVVNNAGINISHPLTEFPEDDWDRLMEVNLKSMFLVCKYAAPHMIRAGGGKIVNMSSKSGGKHGSVNAVGYASSKAGVVGLTKSLALELAPRNINVNAVCPGFVYTPMWEKQAPRYAAKHGLSVHAMKDYYISKIPLGRPQTEDSVAGVVAFLASRESADITGEVISVTGGQ
jgi:NAD(P)-dependent dehydrogenase (short-subunit alcohol dehydrogenase family)